MRKYTEAEIKEARARYRPQRITVLFVGESPPSNGSFFYCGGNNLLRHMRSGVGGPSEDADFLKSFMERGWYLDDLVPTPLNDRSKLGRDKRCRDARTDLASRIVEYRPSGIVCLLRRIRDDVEIAALMANSKACRYVVPFAGHGHQGYFREEMKRILPELEALP
jgi:hypothetical protein